MTREEREEAIEYIKKYRELDVKLYTTQSRNFTIVSKDVVNKYLGYWDMAIEALKQEPVLDKIRAEINELSPIPTAEDVIDGNEVKDAIWEILIEVDKIIDKYRGEVED